MMKGFTRFALYLDQLEELLAGSPGRNDAALWLYQNGARTPIFMLEGLAKLYGGIHNEKRFQKLQEHFKLLEDALGAIDYYDAFAKEFSQDKKVSSDVTAFAHSRPAKKLNC